jgi:hypothetical protein
MRQKERRYILDSVPRPKPTQGGVATQPTATLRACLFNLPVYIVVVVIIIII